MYQQPLTTGVKTWFSTVFLVRVLKTINVSKKTESNIATRPKKTPQVNQVRKNCGLHCANLTNVLFNAVEYHRNWQTDTENPVLSSKVV